MKINIEGKTELFKKNIKDKTVCVCLAGKSLEVLEQKIGDFRNLDICWAGQTNYDILQKEILQQIKSKFSVVLDIATVRNNADYDKYLRLPRIEYLLRTNPEVSILTTHKILSGVLSTIEVANFSPKNNFVYLDIDNISFEIPNSLSLYLLLLTEYGAKQIILFGLDGVPFTTKVNQFPDIQTYYREDLVKKERQIAFGNPNMSALASDSDKLSLNFIELYTNYCNHNQLKQIKIWNCNPTSNFTLFERISYSRAKELCRL